MTTVVSGCPFCGGPDATARRDAPDQQIRSDLHVPHANERGQREAHAPAPGCRMIRPGASRICLGLALAPPAAPPRHRLALAPPAAPPRRRASTPGPPSHAPGPATGPQPEAGAPARNYSGDGAGRCCCGCRLPPPPRGWTPGRWRTCGPPRPPRRSSAAGAAPCSGRRPSSRATTSRAARTSASPRKSTARPITARFVALPSFDGGFSWYSPP